MTTYYEKVYQFGKRLVDNLISMGVDASFSDGGLTLASKILNVNKFNQGVLLSADNLIAQIGDTINLTALYLENDECVNNGLIYFSLLDVVDTTDEYGVANAQYTCSGKGLVEIKAENVIYYDNCKTDTTTKYYIITTSGNGVSFVGNSLRYTVGTANKSIGYDSNYNGSQITLSDYLGKHVRFSVDVNPSSQCRLQISQLVDGSWTTESTYYTSTATTLSIDAEINANATRFAFRIDCTHENSSGDTVDFNNWKIELVDNHKSKTLEVIDALFYDTGIDGSENTHYYYNANAITMDANIDGTTIANSDTTAKYVYAVPSNETLDTGKYYSPSFIVEVDLVGEHSNNCYLRISDVSNNYYYSFGNLDNSFYHLKYVITPTTQQLFIDGSTTPTYSKSFELGNCSIFFVMGASASLKFKNLKIYPIE